MAASALPGYKPLCFIDRKLYLYCKGFLYVLSDGCPSKLFRVYPASWKEGTRVSTRLFRCEPKYAVPLGTNSMLLVGHNQIMLVNPERKESSELARAREGFSDPLNICPATGQWSAIWGDYGSNAKHEAVYLYGLHQSGGVERIFSFAPGQVRHIHNIIPKRAGGYYIFTGDQEDTAGIYEADSEFKRVTPVRTGKQQYRAVIGFDTDEGLLYATDAVNEQNAIYFLKRNGQLEQLALLNGSCIYGTSYHGRYYFSTTVEPDENEKGILSWISMTRGKGILSNEVQLVCLSDDFRAETVAGYQKDALPMKLMQYGSLQFPHGDSDELWIYAVAVRQWDGTAIRIAENERDCYEDSSAGKRIPLRKGSEFGQNKSDRVFCARMGEARA